MLLIIPVIVIVAKAFEDGVGNVFDTLTTPEAQHAFWLTLVMVAIAVPLNTIFGVACAIVLVRHKFRGKAFLNGADRPAVRDLAGRDRPRRWCSSTARSTAGSAPWLLDNGIRVIFTPLGMALATMFVSLPFVVREVEPVLREIGEDQEQAARTLGANGWQTFWRITLPSIRWGVTYGVVLATARALGEFGAVSIVSGRISGETETLPLFVQKQFETFNVSGAYAAALLLALIALATLLAMNLDPQARLEDRVARDPRKDPQEDRSMSIVVENATKKFGDFVALDEVSIEVPDGSLTALLGPSGSGKSTLLRVIAGLETPDSGTGAHLRPGHDARSPVQDRHVGFCFQHYAAFKHMTVRDNVAFGLKIRKKGKDETEERVRELLRLVHLEGFIDRYPSQLSGGQRQRMALARALAVEPKVLLLDEPFGALDAKVREELRAWLRRLHDEVHVTTIFVTHDQEEAMDVAEQIVVMNDGAVEQAGGPRDLYEHPKTEFVMGFVGPVNRVGQGVHPPARPRDPARPRGGRGRGDDRADRPPRLRGAGRAGARRGRAAVGAAHPGAGRGAGAGGEADRLRAAVAQEGVRRDRPADRGARPRVGR